MNDEGEFESLLTLIAEPPRLAEIISETRRELSVLTRGIAYRKCMHEDSEFPAPNYI